MGFQYAHHDDLPMRCMKAHIHDAVCQTISHCTLVLMGTETLGVPVQVGYDKKTGDVRMFWEKDGRLHDGVLEPVKRSVQILLLTDDTKKDLIGECPSEGIPLTLTEHRSRPTQRRTPEQKAAELARRQELIRLRAAGLAPPAVKRERAERTPAILMTRSRLRRGGTLVPVDRGDPGPTQALGR